MTMLRNERFAALLLIAAAAAGLVLANTPAAPLAFAAEGLRLGPLTVGHWIKDGLLAVFFFLAAIELKHELRHGELDSPRKALVPGIAALGGVVVPAVLYLLIAPSLSGGWPIPTATDIAFALGVLSIFGRRLPGRIRALLLALAVIDDLIAILIIAAFFTSSLQPLPLLLAVPVVAAFGLISSRARIGWALPALIVLGLGAWVLVFLSGVHPTIAGVALGLALASKRAERVRPAIEPWSNAIVLPLFALVAALVPIPGGTVALSPAFWAVLVALPVGKLLGITVAGLIAVRLLSRDPLPFGDLLVVAALGGIGFTVSLLMNELAFQAEPAVQDQVTLAVLAGSILAAVVGAVLAAARGRHYLRTDAVRSGS